MSRPGSTVEEKVDIEVKENNLIKAEFEIKTEIKTIRKPVNFNWKGSKISYDVWCQIVEFFRASYKKHKSEAQVRLFYNKDTKQWMAWAFPQETQGMTVQETEGNEMDKQMEQFALPWVPMGTMHHHCTGAAFQSGTDHDDEMGQSGFHVTVGHIDKDYVDIDTRFTYGRAVYDVEIEDFIEVPKFDVPKNYVGCMTSLLICSPEIVEFPKIWLDNVKKKPTTSYRTNFGNKTINTTGVTKKNNSTDWFKRSESTLFDEKDKILTDEEIIACETFIDELIKLQGSVELETSVARNLLNEYQLERDEVDTYLEDELLKEAQMHLKDI